jgi:DNA-binding CsgD family transcriptional regulator
MDGHPLASPLTAREREIASLVKAGLTNRQIGLELSISERTVGAHVQNILNKLGANNRAQIAAWAAQATLGSHRSGNARTAAPAQAGPARTATGRPADASRWRRRWAAGLMTALAVVVAATDDGVGTTTLPANLPTTVGTLAYESKLTGDGEGFTLRYILGEPSASAIRFMSGTVEYAVIKPGGNTGHSVAVVPMLRYYEEVELSVVADSNVEFWITLTTDSNGMTSHLIDLSTGAEAMQLVYFADQVMQPLGPQVTVKGLQSGRKFTVSALVSPPHYVVYLDGRTVTDVQHDVITPHRIPGFGIFGDAPGTVRLTSLRIYSVT